MSATGDAKAPPIDEKRALLARLAGPHRYPPSFAQERLWFLDQLTPGTPFYTIACAIPVRVPLDIAALERGMNAVVARHETLRTTFPVRDGRPEQVVAPALQLPLTVHDVRGLPPAEREAEAGRIAEAEAQVPFDLAAGPLLRAAIVRLGFADHLLLLSMHHIISDGWSLGVLGRELWDCYTAYASGREPMLPELPIQYGDYAVWQREWLQGEVLTGQIEYWRRQLADLTVLELATDRPRPPAQSFEGATTPVRVNAGVTSALKSLSRREGCTLYMTLLAAFQTLLARCSGQEDVVVGTYIAGRNRTETEGLIGFFINTLVMRGDISGDPTFRELLSRTREVALSAYAHQDVPFPKLVEELRPERDLSRNPLFQVVFHLYNAPGVGQEPLPDAEGGSHGGAAFDLILDMIETPAGLEGRIQYATDLFDASSMRRMAENFETLLSAVAASPDRSVWGLPLMTGAERRRLLVELNDTTTPFPREHGIADLFAEQAAQTPDAAAFLVGKEELTYGELDRRSTELAERLRAAGAGRGAVVGVCLERSFELVVALLAIFKAGAAYLPLDASLPRERLQFTMDDAPAVVVVTSDGLEVRTGSDPAPHATAAPTDLAYVIYTSGSTGMPKGVAVEHEQLLNRLHWMWGEYPFAPGEVACAKTPPGFVDSLWELLGPLLRGVPTVLLPEDEVKDPLALVDALGAARVSRIWLVPSLLRVMLDMHPDIQDRLPQLRFWVASGEALDPELYARFCSLLPGAVLYNLYGTSEAWDVTWFDPEREERPAWRIPIGRPLPNVRTYVLDRRRLPVPVGVVGDLYVGGIGLARGYVNRPELTAETFMADPFSPDQGARMYRTGDLARYREDDALEYVGRVDHQIKLRGFRIELGEIEAVLRAHPSVREAAVIVRGDIRDEPSVVAYVVPDADLPTDTLGPALRAYLGDKLPRYMLPAAFVGLDALPLTSSGKLNRRALPAPGSERPGTERSYVAPSTAAERVMTGIWQNVLGLDRVGVDDDFFADLGGHSLLGTQVVSRAREAFQVELPLARLFEAPTVRGVLSAILADPATGRRIERTAELLLDVSAMSEQDVQSMLAARTGQ